MSIPRPPGPALPLAAFLYHDREQAEKAIGAFASLVGGGAVPGPEIDHSPFPGSAYYAREMGPELMKRLVAFDLPFDRSGLIGLKIGALDIERRQCDRSGGRRVNIDPGLLSRDQLLLASCKSAAHRVYLGRGVYAEVELVYRGGAYLPLPWTYPDYREPVLLGFLERLRCRCLAFEADDRPV